MCSIDARPATKSPAVKITRNLFKPNPVTFLNPFYPTVPRNASYFGIIALKTTELKVTQHTA